jgi:cobaltochelatase CobN
VRKACHTPARLRRGAEPDAEWPNLSTAPSGTVLEAFEYLRHGGVRNTENLFRFIADTLLVEGYGFEPPRNTPDLGAYHPGLPEGFLAR